MFTKVIQVIPMRDYSVYAYFEDEKIVRYDMSKMIDPDTLYKLPLVKEQIA